MYLKPPRRFRHYLQSLTTIGLWLWLLLLIACQASATTKQSIVQSDIGIIAVHHLNMRRAPNTNDSPLKVLKKGTRVTILETSSGWLKIRHDEDIGYIQNQTGFVEIIAMPSSVPHDGAGAPQLDRYRREAEQLNQSIAKHQSEVRAMLAKEEDILSLLQEIDLALAESKKRQKEIRREQKEVENSIRQTQIQIETIREQIQDQQKDVEQRLVALYKLNRMGQLQLFTTAASISDWFHRRRALGRILNYDEAKRQKLTAAQQNYQILLNGLNQQKVKKIQLTEAYQRQIQIGSQERKRRRRLLARVRQQKNLELAVIESLKESAIALDRAIEALKAAPQPSLGPSPTGTRPPFKQLKGLLKMPVEGTIVSHFGAQKSTKFNTVSFHSGINIKADRGEPVRCVNDGRVIYARWFKGYGNMMIVDHGDNFYTLYAHVEEMFKNKNDLVEAGEVIATVGDTGSLEGPLLHFQVRHHGKPLNPMEWFGRG